MTLTSTAGRPYGHIAQIIQNRLFFGSFHEVPKNDDHTVHFRIDEFVHYHPFYDDFGPINLAELHKACLCIDELLKVIFHGLSADQAYLRVQRAEPPAFVGFTDAALGEPSYYLHLQHTIKAIEKAIKFKWFDLTTFDPEEYEYYERVENGDLNWILPGKILSFCGPHDRSYVHNGYPYHAPEVYFDYFNENNVSTIVRLNTKLYDKNRFVNAGFDHKDLFFIDGSTPTEEIMVKFIEIVDSAKGAVAVHCKAGLGRTGTLIACWMMKEYRLTAPQCIAWLRICRPGSVIGPQQQFLIDKQAWCWRLGIQQHRTRSPQRKEEKKVEVGEFSLDSPPKATLLKKTDLANGNVVDETAVNSKGQSQGDRLNEMKLRSQRIANNNPPFLSATVIARTATATTPIKQMKLSTVPRPKTDLDTLSNVTGTTRRHVRMPISKVIVATSPTQNKPLGQRYTVKSPRTQPYSISTTSLSKYGLRPRKTLASPTRFDPAPDPRTPFQTLLLRTQQTGLGHKV